MENPQKPYPEKYAESLLIPRATFLKYVERKIVSGPIKKGLGKTKGSQQIWPEETYLCLDGIATLYALKIRNYHELLLHLWLQGVPVAEVKPKLTNVREALIYVYRRFLKRSRQLGGKPFDLPHSDKNKNDSKTQKRLETMMKKLSKKRPVLKLFLKSVEIGQSKGSGEVIIQSLFSCLLSIDSPEIEKSQKLKNTNPWLTVLLPGFKICKELCAKVQDNPFEKLLHSTSAHDLEVARNFVKILFSPLLQSFAEALKPLISADSETLPISSSKIWQLLAAELNSIFSDRKKYLNFEIILFLILFLLLLQGISRIPRKQRKGLFENLKKQPPLIPSFLSILPTLMDPALTKEAKIQALKAVSSDVLEEGGKQVLDDVNGGLYPYAEPHSSN